MAATTEQELITQVVLDYFEGWYDVERMDSALHPDLVKRQAGETLGVTTKERMLELTEQSAGAEDGADRALDIVVADVGAETASATVRSFAYHEHVHLVRTAGGWKIANALWEPR